MWKVHTEILTQEYDINILTNDWLWISTSNQQEGGIIISDCSEPLQPWLNKITLSSIPLIFDE